MNDLKNWHETHLPLVRISGSGDFQFHRYAYGNKSIAYNTNAQCLCLSVIIEISDYTWPSHLAYSHETNIHNLFRLYGKMQISFCFNSYKMSKLVRLFSASISFSSNLFKIQSHNNAHEQYKHDKNWAFVHFEHLDMQYGWNISPITDSSIMMKSLFIAILYRYMYSCSLSKISSLNMKWTFSTVGVLCLMYPYGCEFYHTCERYSYKSHIVPIKMLSSCNVPKWMTSL